MLIFVLLGSYPLGGVDGPLVAEAVEDAKGKGGVPEYLSTFDVSIVYVDQ